MEEKELQEKLASGEYSISPRSGRLRKRIKKTKKKPLYSKKKVNKLLVRIVWILMILALIGSLFILIPEMGQTNYNNKNIDNSQFKRKTPSY